MEDTATKERSAKLANGFQALFGLGKSTGGDDAELNDAGAVRKAGPRSVVRRKKRASAEPLQLEDPIEEPVEALEEVAAPRRPRRPAQGAARTPRKPAAAPRKPGAGPRKPASAVARTPRPTAEAAPVEAPVENADEIQDLIESIQGEASAAPAREEVAAKSYRLRPIFHGATQDLYVDLFDALEMHHPNVTLHAGIAPSAMIQLDADDAASLSNTQIDFLIVDQTGLPIVALVQSGEENALSDVLKRTGLPLVDIRDIASFDELWDQVKHELIDE